MIWQQRPDILSQLTEHPNQPNQKAKDQQPQHAPVKEPHESTAKNERHGQTTNRDAMRNHFPLHELHSGVGREIQAFRTVDVLLGHLAKFLFFSGYCSRKIRQRWI